MPKSNLPTTIPGNLFCDDRGYLSFINGFILSDYKRFYIVENHKRDFIRAWHGHRYEGKAVICIQGAALIGMVNLETEEVTKKVLSASKPEVIVIPAGYANGFKSLTDDCKLLFLSDKTLEESKGDDIRFDFDYWDIWKEEYR